MHLCGLIFLTFLIWRTKYIKFRYKFNWCGTIKLHDFKIPSLPWKGTYLQKLNWHCKLMPIRVSIPPLGKIMTGRKVFSSAKYTEIQRWGSAPPADWNSPNYDDRNWTQGKAEFGYGDGDGSDNFFNMGMIQTTKQSHTISDQNFHIDTISNIVNLSFRFKADDGAVIYVNGKEIYRFNVPSQPTKIEFNTLASSNISGTVENEFRSIGIPKTTFALRRKSDRCGGPPRWIQAVLISVWRRTLAEYVSSVTIVQYSPIYSCQLEKEASNLRAVFENDGHCGILSENISTDTKLVKSLFSIYRNRKCSCQNGS